MRSFVPAFISFILLASSCNNPSSTDTTLEKQDSVSKISTATLKKDTATAAEILLKKQVPVLCYHHIRSLRPGESRRLLGYIVPEKNFKDQMKMLSDSGYHTITPDEYYNYLVFGDALPSKPVMITFDDTDEEQYTVGAAELEKYGFKGVYFIMTISIGRPRYMNSEQLKDLAQKGHVIAAHTWDHHNVKQYKEADWDLQFLKPKQKLEALVGKPVTYFAYPFGLWNEAAIPELKKRGYKAAFQLSASKRDSLNPLFSLRRMIVPGDWEIGTLQKWIRINFPNAD